MIGKMICHYKILERMARDQTEVYLAEDTRFSRKVVLRMLAQMPDQSHAREVFKREVIVASL